MDHHAPHLADRTRLMASRLSQSVAAVCGLEMFYYKIYHACQRESHAPRARWPRRAPRGGLKSDAYRFWRPEQLSQFCARDYPATPWQDLGPKRFRPPKSICRTSRTDFSGSEHLPEQENPLRDSDFAGGVIIHTSFRSLHRAAAREFAGDL